MRTGEDFWILKKILIGVKNVNNVSWYGDRLSISVNYRQSAKKRKKKKKNRQMQMNNILTPKFCWETTCPHPDPSLLQHPCDMLEQVQSMEAPSWVRICSTLSQDTGPVGSILSCLSSGRMGVLWVAKWAPHRPVLFWLWWYLGCYGDWVGVACQVASSRTLTGRSMLFTSSVCGFNVLAYQMCKYIRHAVCCALSKTTETSDSIYCHQIQCVTMSVWCWVFTVMYFIALT